MWPDNGCPLVNFIVQYRAMNEAQWALVSNALKPQRRFVLSGLVPSTRYVVKVEAISIAGSNTAEFSFVTLTKDGGRQTYLLGTGRFRFLRPRTLK